MNASTSAPRTMSWAYPIGAALFAVGLLCLLMGNIMTFVPGSEQSWFSICAVLLACGLLCKPRWLKFAGALLALAAIFAAVDGHRNGLRYRQRLQMRAVSEAAEHR